MKNLKTGVDLLDKYNVSVKDFETLLDIVAADINGKRETLFKLVGKYQFTKSDFTELGVCMAKALADAGKPKKKSLTPSQKS